MARVVFPTLAVDTPPDEGVRKEYDRGDSEKGTGVRDKGDKKGGASRTDGYPQTMCEGHPRDVWGASQKGREREKARSVAGE